MTKLIYYKLGGAFESFISSSTQTINNGTIDIYVEPAEQGTRLSVSEEEQEKRRCLKDVHPVSEGNEEERQCLAAGKRL